MSTETAARNELDVEGEAALYRAFRKFWHPVAYATNGRGPATAGHAAG